MTSIILFGLRRRSVILAAFLILLFLVSCSGGNSPVTPDTADRSTGGPIFDPMEGDSGDGLYAPGEVLLTLNEPLSNPDLIIWAAEFDLRVIDISDVSWGPMYRLKIPQGQIVTDIVDKLNNDSRVRWAEPNYILTFEDAPYVPNDPMWERGDAGNDPRDNVFDQWGPAKSGAPIVWNESIGTEDIVVAVIDTGILYDHEDLFYRLWYNNDEISNNGIDDDANGYVDDWFGWDFHYSDNGPHDTGGYPYHGTACAGIVAAQIDNNRGLTGIAPGVKVMVLRVNLNGWNFNAYVSSVVNALHYAKDNDADIASMSFGSTTYSIAMDEACSYAYDDGNGVVLLGSAGNSGTNDAHWPSGHDSVMAVAACCAFNDANQRIVEQRISAASGFPWGSTWGTQLEISAYGDKYTTTYGEHYSAYWDGNDDFFFGGTSCACPMAAGVVALVKTFNPGENAAWLRDRLRYTCDDIHSLGWDDQSGEGRVNAVRAVYGSDRYSLLEDPMGFVPVNLPSARFHDTIHDVPGNPYHDPEDLYKIEVVGDGPLTISCYIYTWGEDLDLALYSDPAMTNLLADSTIANDPWNNVESIDIDVIAGQTLYLSVHSNNVGDSSLYDLTLENESVFDVIGVDIAPAASPAGGEVALLRLDCSSNGLTTIDGINFQLYGTQPLATIAQIDLYEDTTGNGFYDSGLDELISSVDVTGLNRVRFTDLGIGVSSGNSRSLLVVAFVFPLGGPNTLGVTVQTYKDIATVESYEVAYHRFPMVSSLTQVGG